MYMYFNTRRIGRICRCCVNMIKQQGEEFYNLLDIVSWKLKKIQNIHFRMFLSIFLFIHFLSQYMLYFKSYPLYSYNWPWDLKEVLEMLLLCKELLLWRSEHYCGSSTLIRLEDQTKTLWEPLWRLTCFSIAWIQLCDADMVLF